MSNKYVAVYFSHDESNKFRIFLKMMNGCEIITLSKEEIDECVKEFEKVPYGLTNRLVLHNDEEIRLFNNLMRTFLPDKNYEITDTPNDETFEKWLETKDNNAP